MITASVLKRWLPGLSVVVLAVALFDLTAAQMGGIYLPRVTLIAASFEENWLFDAVETDLLPSLGRMGIGYALALLAGLIAGLILGMALQADHVLTPLIDFLRCIPATALIPLTVVLLGIGDLPKILLIAFTCFWPVLISTRAAIRTIDPVMAESMTVCSVTGRDRIRYLILPAALPQFLAGARVALALALIMAVVTEMVASTNGLGYFVVHAQRTFSIADMWSGVALIGLLGYLFNLLFGAVQWVLLRKYPAAMTTRSSR